jgi:hypothetical protein
MPLPDKKGHPSDKYCRYTCRRQPAPSLKARTGTQHHDPLRQRLLPGFGCCQPLGQRSLPSRFRGRKLGNGGSFFSAGSAFQRNCAGRQQIAAALACCRMAQCTVSFFLPCSSQKHAKIALVRRAQPGRAPVLSVRFGSAPFRCLPLLRPPYRRSGVKKPKQSFVRDLVRIVVFVLTHMRRLIDALHYQSQPPG